MSGVLAGLRVLDFGRFVSGPYCAALLAEFGADVIHIERRGGGEDRAVQEVGDSGDGAVFMQMNRNKRSLTLAPKHPAYQDILDRLVAGADVVVVNVPPPALAAMSLDYARLSAVNPRIILANASSFGDRGPWHARGGFDSVGQAMSGSAYLTGTPGQPYRTPMSWVDHSTGLYLALGVMLALTERAQSGRGQEVGASLLGSALSFSANYLIEQAMTGRDRTPTGNRGMINGPTDFFQTSDGWIAVQVVGDTLFKRWCAMVGAPALADDTRFATDALRGTNSEALCAIMQAWTAPRASVEALDALAAAGIPAAPVLSPRQALDHPQVQASGLLMPAEGATAPLLRVPIALSRTPGHIAAAPPAPGAHSAEVLREFGFTAEEIRVAQEAGAV
jgi:crotonobetainyl-CoA:carnitine CoA-transferase CaiB-like acyl-CoA transferase